MSNALLLDSLELGSETLKHAPVIKLGPVAPEHPKPSSVNDPPFMRSTWHKDPTNISSLSGWVAYQHMFKGETRPREGRPTAYPAWKQHAFILPRAIAPMVVQHISIKYFRLSWPMWMAAIVYIIAFIAFVAMLAFHMNTLALKYGFLDGQVPRDGVPDARLKLTMLGIFFVATVRPLFCCFIAYDRFEMPYTTPWLPVHMFLYTVIFDFWFYIYHRAMHEIDFLWRFHKTVRVPNDPACLMTIYDFLNAILICSSLDHEEEVICILIIPLLAYLIYPVDFPTLWMSSVYITYSEQQPVTGPVLRPFGVEMIGEDHDLHHRNGWRKSFNYGKQTRIWDKLLGTARPRLEMVDENVDW
ncbi:hypothetical protein BS47DRAFT_1338512 [Hydnum rufescens UP504]|uniref:Fatty acid hydroxylase domain-containing protein n=1 Tax=Hydnum rufescens UP504 TaxID=1448309 RepID=A0A9P6B5T0_9AGAM|nr:hypothetical protein BS47DRAFT_1338512 [Hydnum rufescens UP504]